MNIDGWMYYNHAAIPTVPPHKSVNIEPITTGAIWKLDGNPFLARWTSDFDCGYETNWWYTIRYTPFDIGDLSATSRKHIRQAMKKCQVSRIKCDEYKSQIYDCYCAAYNSYDNSELQMSEDDFSRLILTDIKKGIHYWGAFDNETNSLIGFMRVGCHEDYAEIEMSKFNPNYLNLRMSDALYYSVLNYYLSELKLLFVSSGSRSINHITNTEEYKEKTFAFKKAYCHLHVAFSPAFAVAVRLARPFSKLFKKFDRISVFHLVNSILLLDRLSRGCNQ